MSQCRSCVFICPLNSMNHTTAFYEIWYEYYATEEATREYFKFSY
jgi:Pyruvate/2-oxoacid:ferredoxin oxidoreductase delta subunit